MTFGTSQGFTRKETFMVLLIATYLTHVYDQGQELWHFLAAQMRVAITKRMSRKYILLKFSFSLTSWLKVLGLI